MDTNAQRGAYERAALLTGRSDTSYVGEVLDPLVPPILFDRGPYPFFFG